MPDPLSPMPLTHAHQPFKIPARSQSVHRHLFHPMNSAVFRSIPQRGGLKPAPISPAAAARITYSIWNCDPMRPHAAPRGPMQPHAAPRGPKVSSRTAAHPELTEYQSWQAARETSLRRGPKTHPAPRGLLHTHCDPFRPMRPQRVLVHRAKFSINLIPKLARCGRTLQSAHMSLYQFSRPQGLYRDAGMPAEMANPADVVPFY